MKKVIYTFFAALIICSGISLAAGESNLLGTDKLTKGPWRYWAHGALNKAGLKPKYADGAFVANVPNVKKTTFSFLQLMRTVKLEGGKKYKITFVIDVENPGSFPVNYIINKSPWTSYAHMNFKVKKGVNKIEKVFSVKAGTPKVSRSIRFHLGNLRGNVKVSNVKLTAVK